MPIFTRHEYIRSTPTAAEIAADSANHLPSYRRFYAQLVNQNTIDAVVARIGADRLLASQCEHFSEIPLTEWDRIALPLAMRFDALGDSPSRAGLVCVAKEAARQFVEANTEQPHQDEE